MNDYLLKLTFLFNLYEYAFFMSTFKKLDNLN